MNRLYNRSINQLNIQIHLCVQTKKVEKFGSFIKYCVYALFMFVVSKLQVFINK